MKKIKEVIVVEGKDDTKQIAKAVEADTYETNGSAINAEDLKRLALLQTKRGLIIFTDPDFNGERIRKIISSHIPGVKHAFIRRSQGVPSQSHGSLGIEHAAPAVIRQALAKVYTQRETAQPRWSMADLRRLKLTGQADSRKRREQLGDVLGIGYGNGKQLVRRLNMFEISPQELDQALRSMRQQRKDGQDDQESDNR